MTPQELATTLNGREYLEEITTKESDQARNDGLVVVFGASNDLIEFRGAIDDETGCYDGGVVYIDKEGLMPSWDDMTDIDEAREFFKREAVQVEIEAIWDEDGYSWTYKTPIPHAVFDVMEDGEKYCRGMVFRLADVVPAELAP